MSARDSESGSSSYKGGSGNAGGLGNGGVGGGMGGGNRGGGAGYNGGIGSRTGLTTGTNWNGTSAFGRPGGPATAYGNNSSQPRQNSIQGLISRLMGNNIPIPTARPVRGVTPPQVQPPMPPMNPDMVSLPYMPQYPEPPLGMNTPGVMVTNFPPQSPLKPGQPKYQDRVPSGVGPGGWPGQANGPHWSRTNSAPNGVNWGGGYSGYTSPPRDRGGGGGGW